MPTTSPRSPGSPTTTSWTSASLAGEAISLNEPIAPLCEAACPGLCITCGERLGPGHAAHDEDDVDPRLEALRAFRVDGEGESE